MDRLFFFDFMANYGDFIIIRFKTFLIYFYKVLLDFFVNLRNLVWVLLANRLNDNQRKVLIKIGGVVSLLIRFFFFILKNIKSFLKILIIIMFTVWFFLICYKRKRIFNFIGFGYKDLVAFGTIIEYFVWDSAFDKSDKSRTFSSTAKRSLFLAGSFCLKRGYIFDIIK